MAHTRLPAILIPWPQDFLFGDTMRTVFRKFGTTPNVDFSIFLPKGVSIFSFGVNPQTGAIYLGIQAAHHFFLAVTLILSALLLLLIKPTYGKSQFWPMSARNGASHHVQLAGSLLFLAAASFTYAHHAYALPCYPYLATDYPTVLSLFTHHQWIGGYFTVGAFAHVAIFMNEDFAFIPSNAKCTQSSSHALQTMSQEILSHRCVIAGHLSYVVMWLGLHAFGIYVHNDKHKSLAQLTSWCITSTPSLSTVLSSSS